MTWSEADKVLLQEARKLRRHAKQIRRFVTRTELQGPWPNELEDELRQARDELRVAVGVMLIGSVAETLRQRMSGNHPR